MGVVGGHGHRPKDFAHWVVGNLHELVKVDPFAIEVHELLLTRSPGPIAQKFTDGIFPEGGNTVNLRKFLAKQ